MDEINSNSNITRRSSNKVLLMSIDNLRYDCVGYVNDKAHLKHYYYDKLVDTRNLDGIASNSAVFTNCFSTCSYTPPAHASLFTGLYPPKHGVRPFFYKRLNNECLTIAEIYKNNGYKTVFYSDVFGLFGPMGMTKGFDYVFDKNFTEFTKLLDSFKNDKVFAFIHVFDIHEPYIFSECPPDMHYNDDYFEFMKNMSNLYNIQMNKNDPYALWNSFSTATHFGQSFMLPPYIYGVNKFDAGRFKLIHNSLKELNYFNNDNIYAIFSDHGEGRISLLDKPVFGHMGELFDEVIHVPLIFHAPGIENKTYDKLVSITDIYPSLISLSQLDKNKSLCDEVISENIEIEIDGIPLFEERQSCYSEYYIQNMYNEVMQFTSNEFDRSKQGASLRDKYFLAQQAIRTKDKKYIFTPERMTREEVQKMIENLSISDEDYIIWLFSSILRKRIVKAEYLYFLNILKTKKGSRADIYKTIMASVDYNRPLNYYYDLAIDPFEEKPLVFSDMNLTDVNENLKFLNELKNKSVDTADVFTYFDNNIKKAEDKNGSGNADKSDNSSARRVNAPSNGSGNNNDKNNNSDNITENEKKIELLKSKILFSTEIIKEARSRYGDKIGIAFTGGKDSTVLLDLVRRAYNGEVFFKIITVDTGCEFPEIVEFMNKLKKDWNFDLKVYSNKEAFKTITIAADRQICCNLLKTVPLKNAIKELGLKGLMTGIRKDEQESRAGEIYFSKREHPRHYRIHPILHFTENDIWDYIKLYNLPYCSLYDQEYRSIDCMPCTQKTKSADEAERAGRSKEKEAVMDKLRDLGYF
jgi:phosphoadenosine phosphosulfate reductase